MAKFEDRNYEVFEMMCLIKNEADVDKKREKVIEFYDQVFQ